MRKLLFVTLLAVAAAAPAISDAAARKRQPAPPAEAGPPKTLNIVSPYGQPAKMIQLPNGRWVSSYGCYTEERPGVYYPCGASEVH